MATLTAPDTGLRLEGFEPVRDWLALRGILHERWSAVEPLPRGAGQEAVLAAYERDLAPLMARRGYRTADVVTVREDTPNVAELRAKFLREHVHDEDEVRLFIEGAGLFWFNLGGVEPVVALLCTAGDLVSVPAGTRHWFDFGARPCVRAIRVFTDPSGWVARYTGSGVDEKYNALAAARGLSLA